MGITIFVPFHKSLADSTALIQSKSCCRAMRLPTYRRKISKLHRRDLYIARKQQIRTLLEVCIVLHPQQFLRPGTPPFKSRFYWADAHSARRRNAGLALTTKYPYSSRISTDLRDLSKNHEYAVVHVRARRASQVWQYRSI